MNEHQYTVSELIQAMKGRRIDKALADQFSPFVITKWIASANVPEQVILANEMINKQYWWLSYDTNVYPAVANSCLLSSPYTKYNFTKTLSTKASDVKKSKVYQLFKKYYDYSVVEFEQIRDLITEEMVVSMAYDLGYEDKEIKQITKEL